MDRLWKYRESKFRHSWKTRTNTVCNKSLFNHGRVATLAQSVERWLAERELAYQCLKVMETWIHGLFLTNSKPFARLGRPRREGGHISNTKRKNGSISSLHTRYLTGKVRDCWGNKPSTSTRRGRVGRENWLWSQITIIRNDHVSGGTVKFKVEGRKALQQQQAFANPRESARVFKIPAMT